MLVAADGPGPPDRREGGVPPSDYRYIDRLGYMLNGEGFLHDRVVQLSVVDVETGRVRPLTRGRTDASGPAWSPDGRQVAFAADRSRDFDLRERSDIFVVDVATGRERVVTGGRRAVFRAPQWLPDGRTIAAIGHRLGVGGGTRADLWLFAADGSDAGPDGGRNLTAAHDLMLAAGMAGDLTPSEGSVLRISRDGRWISFIAPDNRGAAELWRVRVEDGRVERLTEGRHQISSFDAVSIRGATRYAVIRSDATTPAEVEVLDVPERGRAAGSTPARRRLTDINTAAAADIEWIEPEERWTEVDGRRDPGLVLPGARRAPQTGLPRWSPRSTAAPTPTTAGPRCWSSRCSQGPGSAYTRRTRAGPRATARPSMPRTIATGPTDLRATCSGGSTRSWPRAAPIRSASASRVARTGAT